MAGDQATANIAKVGYKGFDATQEPSSLGWSQLGIVAKLLDIDTDNISNREKIEQAILERLR